MAKAAELADHIIETDDNPRNEDPAKIRADIIAGFSTSNYTEIAGREQAIKHAITQSKAGDIILIAGKGHENYQIIAGKKYDCDDAYIAYSFLNNVN